MPKIITENTSAKIFLTQMVQLLGAITLMFSVSGCFWQNQDAKFERLKRKGHEHYVRREFEQALAIFNKALSIRPNHVGIHRKIGKTYVKMAQVDNAAEAFYRAIEIAPDSPDIWFELGKLQLASHNVSAAEASWEHIKVKVNDPSVYTFYGDLMAVKRQLADAVTAYLHALDLSPNLDVVRVKLASCYLAQGKMDLAKSSLSPVTSKKVDSSRVHFQLANFYRIAGNLRLVEDHMIYAIMAAPDDLGLQNAIAEFYFDSGNYKLAQIALKKILGQAPKNRFIKKFLAETYLMQDNFKEARSVLDELGQEQNSDLELHLLNGKYYLLKQDTVSSMSHLKLAVEKEPNFPFAHYLLALSYLAGGQMALAQGSLIEALTLDSTFTDAELMLSDIYYKKEEFDLSFKHAERITEKEPENFRARLIMGNILLAQKKYGEAIEKFNAAHLLHPESSSPDYYIAFTSQLSNNIESSLQHYLSLLKQDPDLMDATMAYTMMLVEIGEATAVENYLTDVLSKFPGNHFLHHILGEVYLKTGRQKKAIASFRKAIRINSDLITSYMRLVQIYQAESDQKQLTKVLNECIGQFPYYSGAYIQMANLHHTNGAHDKAIDILEKALRRAPESPKIANCLAWLYLERGASIDKAFKLAQFAYQRRPEDPAVADTLGWIYYKKKLFTQAVWLLKDALSRTPDHPTVHYHLGMTFNAMGNEKSARENLGRALALNLDTVYREEAKRVFEQLEN